jgi:hypothetical protein
MIFLLVLFHAGVTVFSVWQAFFFSKVGFILGFPISIFACTVNTLTVAFGWMVYSKKMLFSTIVVADNAQGEQSEA